MNLNQLTSHFDGFCGYGAMNFNSPSPLSSFASDQPSQSEERGFRTSTEMGFQILSPLLEENKTMEGGSNSANQIFDEKSLSLKFVGEEEAEEMKSSVVGKSSSRHTKLCVRGHWRSAEDAKLKELVTQYGPQNWNLIADQLQGRSGN